MSLKHYNKTTFKVRGLNTRSKAMAARPDSSVG